MHKVLAVVGMAGLLAAPAAPYARAVEAASAAPDAPAAAAPRAAETPSDLMRRHIAAIRAKDVDAIMRDYADDAKLISQFSVLQGKPAVRKYFTDLLAAFSAKPVTLDIRKIWHEGNVAYVTWETGGLKGSDLMVLRPDGKIGTQAFFYGTNEPPAK